eukprot:6128803-Prymnesium_polylepis.2
MAAAVTVRWLADSITAAMRWLLANLLGRHAPLVRAVLPGWLASSSALSSPTALARARALRAPSAKVTHKGDMEHAEWWETHEAALAAGWAEFGRGDDRVYSLQRDALDPCALT